MEILAVRGRCLIEIIVINLLFLISVYSPYDYVNKLFDKINNAIFTGFTLWKNTIVYVLTINMALVPALHFVFCVIQDESKCTFYST